MHPFAKRYTEQAVPKLQEQYTYASPYQIPKVEKVVLNMGLGDVATNNNLEPVLELLAKITGQKPVVTKARKAIAGFKIRQGMVVGAKVTLRGQRMHDFLEKFITVSLPRTRDFRGVTPSGIQSSGSLHIGVKDSMIFPEVAQENISHPLEVSLVARTSSLEEARTFYEGLGFIFQGN